jgi:hypothetical protein
MYSCRMSWMMVDDLLGYLLLSRSTAAAFLSRYRLRYSTCLVRISFMFFWRV